MDGRCAACRETFHLSSLSAWFTLCLNSARVRSSPHVHHRRTPLRALSTRWFRSPGRYRSPSGTRTSPRLGQLSCGKDANGSLTVRPSKGAPSCRRANARGPHRRAGNPGNRKSRWSRGIHSDSILPEKETRSQVFAIDLLRSAPDRPK